MLFCISQRTLKKIEISGYLDCRRSSISIVSLALSNPAEILILDAFPSQKSFPFSLLEKEWLWHFSIPPPSLLFFWIFLLVVIFFSSCASASSYSFFLFSILSSSPSRFLLLFFLNSTEELPFPVMDGCKTKKKYHCLFWIELKNEFKNKVLLQKRKMISRVWFKKESISFFFQQLQYIHIFFLNSTEELISRK